MATYADRLFRMEHRDVDDDELAELTVDRLGIWYVGDPKPQHSINPTPEEIAEACRQIRAGWTKEERRMRRRRKIADRQ